MSSSSNSCIETTAAPEWLQKLENRREKLARSKLGHELDAGAKCNECGDKCPGLDLHFWRKVCRNCKCRKEQHLCTDGDLSGWAQFEILGQIRSKPAFIKIRALASQPVQLEWVPPNAAPDLVSDYMEKLGATQIPVAGSNAAQKRKQQLEYQVPPHDLDATLCHNLSESEANQLLQYVQKIRQNCVGQGNVVRIGGLAHAMVGHVSSKATVDNFTKSEYAHVMEWLNKVPVNDALLAEILSEEKLAQAIVSEPVNSYPKMLIAFSKPISTISPPEIEPLLLSNAVKAKLFGLNKNAIGSLVHNGPIYDKILAALKEKNLNVSRDPLLGPIADFRKEYLHNRQFKNEIDSLNECHNLAQYTTPLKPKTADIVFNSPLPLKQSGQTRFGSQMRQETPLRKVKFGGVSTIVYDCGLPSNVDYEKDPIFARIINSVPLKNAFEQLRIGGTAGPVVIAATPLPPDFIDEIQLSQPVKERLSTFRVDTQTLQSALLNGPFYDRLFDTLKNKGIDYNKCSLLKPLSNLRQQLRNDPQLFEEVREFIQQMPNNQTISYDKPQQAMKAKLTGSNSNDSGFESKPSTPNAPYVDDVHALTGKFASIPGIEDMNMYPTVELPPQSPLIDGMQKLTMEEMPAPVLTPKCADCTQPINFGEVAVKAERAALDTAWHVKCFKCHICRELLADLVYFFHGGEVYCGRDLAIKLKIPRCKACDELIFTKEYTAAEGATFHIKHFCCYQCDTPLAGHQYIPDEKSNMPLCLQCYEEYFAAACQHCQQPIGASGQGVAWGDIHWHSACFICAGVDCGKSLIGGRFCVKENKPFCSPKCVRSIIK